MKVTIDIDGKSAKEAAVAVKEKAAARAKEARESIVKWGGWKSVFDFALCAAGLCALFGGIFLVWAGKLDILVFFGALTAVIAFFSWKEKDATGWVAVVAGLFVLLLLTASNSARAETPEKQTRLIERWEFVDGDSTFRNAKFRARLEFCDTPEWNDPRGAAATAFAREWAADNAPVFYRFDNPARRGKYGRVLVEVINGRGETLCAALIDAGLAREWL